MKSIIVLYVLLLLFGTTAQATELENEVQFPQLLELPAVLLEEVIGQLDLESTRSLGKTCKSFYFQTADAPSWKEGCFQLSLIEFENPSQDEFKRMIRAELESYPDQENRNWRWRDACVLMQKLHMTSKAEKSLLKQLVAFDGLSNSMRVSKLSMFPMLFFGGILICEFIRNGNGDAFHLSLAGFYTLLLAGITSTHYIEPSITGNISPHRVPLEILYRFQAFLVKRKQKRILAEFSDTFGEIPVLSSIGCRSNLLKYSTSLLIKLEKAKPIFFTLMTDLKSTQEEILKVLERKKEEEGRTGEEQPMLNLMRSISYIWMQNHIPLLSIQDMWNETLQGLTHQDQQKLFDLMKITAMETAFAVGVSPALIPWVATWCVGEINRVF